MHDQTIDTMQEAQHEGLTTAQDKVLSILPIPSAILSIFGSSIIIYMAVSTRRQRQWTTYTRLLLGLSICDIISSVSLAFAAFMRRPESGRVWAIGNDATCAAIGTMTQFSYSNVWYNAVLSYYFIATVRFRMKHSRIAKLLEPWMHFVSIGYPLVTAIVGASYGMYGEKATGMGCWVNEYPHGCGDGPDQEPCTSGLIGWLYLGLPLLLSGFSILINNSIIGCHVWKQSVPIKSSSLSRTVTAKSVSSEEGLDVSDGEIGAAKNEIRVVEERMSKHQLQRLKLVSSQAFLFVASYVICNVWVGSLGIVEAITSEDNEPQLMQNMYYIMAINAFFAPLQGFLNMMVYIRPKYLKNRQDFPLETKLWTARRAIFGERVRPHRFIQQGNDEEEEEKRPESVEPTKVEVGSPIQSGGMEDEESLHSLSHEKIVSSITISFWEFDQDSEFSDELHDSDARLRSQRWVDGDNGDVSNAVPTSRRKSAIQTNFHNSLSSLGRNLPFISEISGPELDPVVDNRTIDVDDTSHSSDDLEGIVNNIRTSEARWGSTAADNVGEGKASQNLDGFKRSDCSSASSALVAPLRRPSDKEAIASMWAASLGFKLTPDLNDAPIVAPKRHRSDSELEEEGTIDNGLKRSSSPNPSQLIPPKRLPSEHDPVEPVEIPLDNVEKASVPSLKKHDSPLLVPQRYASDYGKEGITLNKVVKRSSTSNTSALVAPQRCPSDREAVAPNVVKKKRSMSPKKKRSLSPNFLPVPPRRVPTEYEVSDELKLPNDHELVHELVANKVIEKERSTSPKKKPSMSPILPPVPPRRVPTEDDFSDELKLPNVREVVAPNVVMKKRSMSPKKKRSTSPNFSPVPPRRVPTEYEISDELKQEWLKLPNDHEVVATKVVKKKKRSLSPNFSPVPPRRVSTEYEVSDELKLPIAASTVVEKKRSQSPNHQSPPVLPRRVPTEYETTGEESVMGV
mmetsp:Transcript_33419/g.80906  ORF Transcript_33419/g.80906 Transcript_33419/m.80906 type:complete len:964 (-) Transcript_33419:57-2948(-)